MRWRAICAAGRGSVSPRDSRRLGLCGRTKHGRPSRRSAARRARCHSTGLGGRAVCLSVLVLFLESNSDLGARSRHTVCVSLSKTQKPQVCKCAKCSKVLQSAPNRNTKEQNAPKLSAARRGAPGAGGRAARPARVAVWPVCVLCVASGAAARESAMCRCRGPALCARAPHKISILTKIHMLKKED